MRYKRSSFIKWLVDEKGCEITNLNDHRARVITISNGIANTYMLSTNAIDYEEIYIQCNKLHIVGLPGESDLERAT